MGFSHIGLIAEEGVFIYQIENFFVIRSHAVNILVLSHKPVLCGYDPQ
jgi:hypothetical protein